MVDGQKIRDKRKGADGRAVVQRQGSRGTIGGSNKEWQKGRKRGEGRSIGRCSSWRAEEKGPERRAERREQR
jgi:hypothetical protein